MANDLVISVQVKGDKELQAKLRRFGVSILNLTDSMKETGNYLTNFFSGEVFASRGRVIGHPWPRLNDRYAAYKARRWPGRPPLIRTGLMNRSFKSKAAALSVRIFNEAPYFGAHQTGSGHVPARVMMDIDRSREQQIVKIIAADIARKMEAA